MHGARCSGINQRKCHFSLEQQCLSDVQTPGYSMQSVKSNCVLISSPDNHTAGEDTRDCPVTSLLSIITVPTWFFWETVLMHKPEHFGNAIKPLNQKRSGVKLKVFAIWKQLQFEIKSELSEMGLETACKIVIILHNSVFHYLSTCSCCCSHVVIDKAVLRQSLTVDAPGSGYPHSKAQRNPCLQNTQASGPLKDGSQWNTSVWELRNF